MRLRLTFLFTITVIAVILTPPHHDVSIPSFTQPNPHFPSLLLFSSLFLSSLAYFPPLTLDGNEKKYSVESRRTFQIIALLSKFFTATREVASEVKTPRF